MQIPHFVRDDKVGIWDDKVGIRDDKVGIHDDKGGVQDDMAVAATNDVLVFLQQC